MLQCFFCCYCLCHLAPSDTGNRSLLGVIKPHHRSHSFFGLRIVVASDGRVATAAHAVWVLEQSCRVEESRELLLLVHAVWRRDLAETKRRLLNPQTPKSLSP